MEINACHCSGPGSQLVPGFVQSAPAPELQIHLTPDDCSKQSPALRRRISAHVPEVQMPMFAKILPFLSQIEFCPFLQDFDYFEMVAMTAMVANTPMLAPCPIIVQL